MSEAIFQWKSLANHITLTHASFYTWIPINISAQTILVNTLRPRQNGCRFEDDIFKCIFLNENVWIMIKISLNFVTKGSINDIPALVQIMDWSQPGNKPLSKPMMIDLLRHIYFTLPQSLKPCTMFSPHSNGADCWNCPSLKRRCTLFHIVRTSTVDDLLTEGSTASRAMVLTFFSRIFGFQHLKGKISDFSCKWTIILQFQIQWNLS